MKLRSISASLSSRFSLLSVLYEAKRSAATEKLYRQAVYEHRAKRGLLSSFLPKEGRNRQPINQRFFGISRQTLSEWRQRGRVRAYEQWLGQHFPGSGAEMQRVRKTRPLIISLSVHHTINYAVYLQLFQSFLMCSFLLYSIINDIPFYAHATVLITTHTAVIAIIARESPYDSCLLSQQSRVIGNSHGPQLNHRSSRSRDISRLTAKGWWMRLLLLFANRNGIV